MLKKRFRWGLLAAVAAATILAFRCQSPPAKRDAEPAEEIPARQGTFVVFGDTQQWPVLEWFVAGGPKERAKIRNGISAEEPDLVLLAGDAVGAGLYKPFWTQFRKEYADFRIYPVIGNHDLMGSDGACLRHYFETFPHLNGRRWYEIRLLEVSFLMLDSNHKSLRREDWKAQREWLVERLQAAETDSSIRAVVLVGHHPPISASSGGGDARVKSDLFDTAAAYRKFRVFFCGHHHAYQHIEEGPRHVFVTGGGGAPQYFKRSGKLPGGARLVLARKAHHFMRCDIGPGGLVIQMRELQSDGAFRVSESVHLPFETP
jgi:3',5'-cyclic AMP phosphodiesterase CpdA